MLFLDFLKAKIIYNDLTQSYEIRNQTFSDITWQDLTFSKQQANATLAFFSCHFQNMSFINCQLLDVSFHNCQFTHCQLNQNQISILSEAHQAQDTSWSFINCNLTNNNIDSPLSASTWSSPQLANSTFQNVTIGKLGPVIQWQVLSSEHIRLQNVTWTGVSLVDANLDEINNSTFNVFTWTRGAFNNISNSQFNSSNFNSINGMGNLVHLQNNQFYYFGWAGSDFDHAQTIPEYHFEDLIFDHSILGSLRNNASLLVMKNIKISKSLLFSSQLNFHELQNVTISEASEVRDSLWKVNLTSNIALTNTVMSYGTSILGNPSLSSMIFSNCTWTTDQKSQSIISGLKTAEFIYCQIDNTLIYNSNSVFNLCELSTNLGYKTLQIYNAHITNSTAYSQLNLDNCTVSNTQFKSGESKFNNSQGTNLRFTNSRALFFSSNISNSTLNSGGIELNQSSLNNIVSNEMEIRAESSQLTNLSGNNNEIIISTGDVKYSGGSLSKAWFRIYDTAIGTTINNITCTDCILTGTFNELVSHFIFVNSLTLRQIDYFKMLFISKIVMNQLVLNDVRNADLDKLLENWNGQLSIEGPLFQIDLANKQLNGTIIHFQYPNDYSISNTNLTNTNFRNLTILSPGNTDGIALALVSTVGNLFRGLDLRGARVVGLDIDVSDSNSYHSYTPCDLDKNIFNDLGILIDDWTLFRPSNCDTTFIVLVTLGSAALLACIMMAALKSYDLYRKTFEKPCLALETGKLSSIRSLTYDLPIQSYPLIRGPSL